MVAQLEGMLTTLRPASNTTEEDSVYSTFQPTPIEISNDTISDSTHSETVTPATTCTSDNAAAPELVISTRPTRARRPPKRFNDFVAHILKGKRCSNLLESIRVTEHYNR